MTNLYLLFFFLLFPSILTSSESVPKCLNAFHSLGFLSLFCAYLLFFSISMEQSFLKFGQIETIIREAPKKLCNRLLGSVRGVWGGGWLFQGLLEHTQEALKRVEQNPC